MNNIFKHILYWLCLRLRSIQRFLDYVYVSQSDYSHFIQLGKVLTCLLCFFFLLICSQPLEIRAETPTPTPDFGYTSEPNPDPIWETPTPAGIKNYGCPDGNPTGWLTVTPDPVWMFNCAHCIDQGYGYDWGPTPDYGDYPPGMDTPTPTGPEAPQDYEGEDTKAWWKFMAEDSINLVSGEKVENTFIGGRASYFVSSLHITLEEENLFANDWKNTVQMEFDLQINIPSNLYSAYEAKFYFYVKNRRPGQTIIVTFNPGESTEFDITLGYWEEYRVNYLTFYQEQGTYTFTGTLYVDIENQDPDSGALSQVQITHDREHWLTGDGIINIDTTWWNYPATPGGEEPTGPTDCDSVLPIGSGNGTDDDDIFKLPTIGFGNNACFTVGGFDIPLSWLNIFFGGGAIMDWYVPGISFCFQALHFDHITLFGIPIDLDWIAMGMAGVVLFRFFTRS